MQCHVPQTGQANGPAHGCPAYEDTEGWETVDKVAEREEMCAPLSLTKGALKASAGTVRRLKKDVLHKK